MTTSETFLQRARYERDYCMRQSEPDPRWDADRARSVDLIITRWHVANLYARVGHGEDIDAVLTDELAKMEPRITPNVVRLGSARGTLMNEAHAMREYLRNERS